MRNIYIKDELGGYCLRGYPFLCPYSGNSPQPPSQGKQDDGRGYSRGRLCPLVRLHCEDGVACVDELGYALQGGFGACRDAPASRAKEALNQKYVFIV